MTDKTDKRNIHAAIASLMAAGDDIEDPFKIIVDRGIIDAHEVELPEDLQQFLSKGWERLSKQLREEVWSPQESDIADCAFEQYTQALYILDIIRENGRKLSANSVYERSPLGSEIRNENLIRQTLGDILMSSISKHVMLELQSLNEEKYTNPEMVRKMLGSIIVHTRSAYHGAAKQGFEPCSQSTLFVPTREHCGMNDKRIYDALSESPTKYSDKLRKVMREEHVDRSR